MEAIPVLDLRLLTQAEIKEIAASTSPAAGGDNDDFIVPKIDRAVFNESVGSRRQTYSRIRLAPRRSAHLSRSGYSYSRYSAVSAAKDESRRQENGQIVKFLRQLFFRNGIEISPDDDPKPGVIENYPATITTSSADTAVPWTNQDLFEEKLAKMTEGMGTEEQLLEFLGELEGRWASSRKRRKIVNASNFASALPKGWKILLGLQRKRRSIRIYCRQYISPCGKLFSSYNDAASYLLSHAGHEHANPTIPHEATCDGSRNLQSPALDSNLSDSLDVANELKLEHQQTLSCEKCHISFADKDSELQHSRAFHRQGRKRRRPGESLTDGVILRDGAYECQFCHKSFPTRHKYQGHVGVHIRFSDWGLDSPKPALTSPVDHGVEAVSRVDTSCPNGGERENPFMQTDDVSMSVDFGLDSSEPALTSPVDHGAEAVSWVGTSCPNGGERENPFLQTDDVSISVDFGLDSSEPALTSSVDHGAETVPRVDSSCPNGGKRDDHSMQIDDISNSTDFGLDPSEPALTPVDHGTEAILRVDASYPTGGEGDGHFLRTDDVSTPVDFRLNSSKPTLTSPVDHGAEVVSRVDSSCPNDGEGDDHFLQTDDISNSTDFGLDSSKPALTSVDRGAEAIVRVDASCPNDGERDNHFLQTDDISNSVDFGLDSLKPALTSVDHVAEATLRVDASCPNGSESDDLIFLQIDDVSNSVACGLDSSQPELTFSVDHGVEADFTVDGFSQAEEKESNNHDVISLAGDVSSSAEEKCSEEKSLQDGLNAGIVSVNGDDAIETTMPSGGNHGEMEIKMMDQPSETGKDGDLGSS